MYHIHTRSFPLQIFMLWFIIPYRLKKVLFIFTIFVQISEFSILTIPHRLLLLFAPPAGDLLDSSQADIRNPLRYAALHRITASQFIRLYKIFRLSSQIFKTLLTVPSHFDGILLIK